MSGGGGGGGKRRDFHSRIQGMPSSSARLIAASTVSTVRGGGGSPGLAGGRSRISQEQLAGISSSNVMAGIARGQIVGGPRQHVAKREEALHRPQSSSTPSAHTLSVAEQEGVEPIDYEEFVSQQSERDPLGWVGLHHDSYTYF